MAARPPPPSWSTPFTGWICHGVPNPGLAKYASIARQLVHAGFAAQPLVDGQTGLVFRFRQAKNKFAVSATFKGCLDELCPNTQWKFHPATENDDVCAVEPAAGSSADVASSADPAVASAADDSASAAAQPHPPSAQPLATKRSHSTLERPSLLSGFIGGGRHADAYPGLEESLRTPWPQDSCLGEGTYGVVRAFEKSCGAKSRRTGEQAEASQLPVVAVTAGVVFSGGGLGQSNTYEQNLPQSPRPLKQAVPLVASATAVINACTAMHFDF